MIRFYGNAEQKILNELFNVKFLNENLTPISYEFDEDDFVKIEIKLNDEQLEKIGTRLMKGYVNNE